MSLLLNAASVRPWRPLVDLEWNPRIEAVLKEISDALWERRESLDPSLATGLAGAALFLGHLSRRPGWQHLEPRSMELLGDAVARIEEAPLAGFYGGFPGIAWCVEHLRKEVFAPEEEDPNTEVDDLVAEVIDVDRWDYDYDLIGGLVGLGVYALERLPLESGRRLLAKVVRLLEGRAVPRGGGLAWPTPAEHLPEWQRERCPHGYLNLGVAHGMPGVLALLAAARLHGVEADRCKRLLDGGLVALRGFLQDPLVGAYLPTWCPLELDRPEPSSSRLAWCYSDLGGSVAIGEVAAAMGCAEWGADALAMAQLAAARSLVDSGVKDAGLCHGSAGNLHLFNHWYQATGDPVFRAVAHAYLEQTFDYRDEDRGFAGVWSHALATEIHPNDYDPNPGLLEGAAGVGLALLACLGGAAPTWDRFLLLSAPAPEDAG